eukprot:gnl/TRDRNA2_/TRDRNA2_187875_c0_seq1.p1 gnl/TRDRNA2_/TRDRNA2_187875_c0~~gnl/TRDRNA2_/TRDRNA2_187875_c0_seq1.p1  ORF type:complete len:168 (+),score=50.87 gnl/TRDRNA2_/TRDRNA2_187875_c0_seq1:63-566(+)
MRIVVLALALVVAALIAGANGAAPQHVRRISPSLRLGLLQKAHRHLIADDDDDDSDADEAGDEAAESSAPSPPATSLTATNDIRYGMYDFAHEGSVKVLGPTAAAEQVRREASGDQAEDAQTASSSADAQSEDSEDDENDVSDDYKAKDADRSLSAAEEDDSEDDKA